MADDKCRYCKFAHQFEGKWYCHAIPPLRGGGVKEAEIPHYKRRYPQVDPDNADMCIWYKKKPT